MIRGNGTDPNMLSMKLNLEQHEITIILNALSERPYMEVAALIRKIVAQSAAKEGE